MSEEFEQKETEGTEMGYDQTVKSCPFCGNGCLSIAEGSTFRYRRIDCPECLAHGPEIRVQTTGDGSKEQWEAQAESEAIKEWNTRQGPEGDVHYILEGNPKDEQGAWRIVWPGRLYENEISARSAEKHRRKIYEGGGSLFNDFRVVKVTTIREVDDHILIGGRRAQSFRENGCLFG